MKNIDTRTVIKAYKKKGNKTTKITKCENSRRKKGKT